MKRNVVPWDFCLAEHTYVQALRSRREVAQQLRGEEQVHLAGIDHVHRREQVADLNLGTGFLPGLAGSTLGLGFSEFHEAGRHRPVAVARFYRALAQQDFAVFFGDAADHHERILVVNVSAGIADPALVGISLGDFARNLLAAKGTKIHGKAD